MIYIDFSLLVMLMLPVIMKRQIIRDYFGVVHDSIDVTQDNAIQLYEDTDYILKFNELKEYVEHYLNDQHDPADRRIRIEDVEQEENTYLFNKNELNENLFLYNNDSENNVDENGQIIDLNIYLFDDLEIDDLEDFVVLVPNGLVFNESLMKKHINRFKLPGMKYSIAEY